MLKEVFYGGNHWGRDDYRLNLALGIQYGE
jgi:hypothetical protein